MHIFTITFRVVVLSLPGVLLVPRTSNVFQSSHGILGIVRSTAKTAKTLEASLPLALVVGLDPIEFSMLTSIRTWTLGVVRDSSLRLHVFIVFLLLLRLLLY